MITLTLTLTLTTTLTLVLTLTLTLTLILTLAKVFFCGARLYLNRCHRLSTPRRPAQNQLLHDMYQPNPKASSQAFSSSIMRLLFLVPARTVPHFFIVHTFLCAPQAYKKNRLVPQINIW